MTTWCPEIRRGPYSHLSSSPQQYYDISQTCGLGRILTQLLLFRHQYFYTGGSSKSRYGVLTWWQEQANPSRLGTGHAWDITLEISRNNWWEFWEEQLRAGCCTVDAKSCHHLEFILMGPPMYIQAQEVWRQWVRSLVSSAWGEAADWWPYTPVDLSDWPSACRGHSSVVAIWHYGSVCILSSAQTACVTDSFCEKENQTV